MISTFRAGADRQLWSFWFSHTKAVYLQMPKIWELTKGAMCERAIWKFLSQYFENIPMSPLTAEFLQVV
jgi:hypothetical protein